MGKMNLRRCRAAVAVAFAFAVAVLARDVAASAQQEQQQQPEPQQQQPQSQPQQEEMDGRSCVPSAYEKMPRTTLGFDDGGCYLCVRGPRPEPPSLDFAVLAGEALASRCRALCDADPEGCRAVSVGHEASFPPQKHRFGASKFANCCLERRSDYPPGAFVERDPERGAKDDCEREVMCWTRYEKQRGEEGRCPASSASKEEEPLDHCEEIWKPGTLSESEVEENVKFIEGGCERNDTEWTRLLTASSDQCRAEHFVDKVGLTVVSHGGAAHLRLLLAGGKGP